MTAPEKRWRGRKGLKVFSRYQVASFLRGRTSRGFSDELIKPGGGFGGKCLADGAFGFAFPAVAYNREMGLSRAAGSIFSGAIARGYHLSKNSNVEDERALFVLFSVTAFLGRRKSMFYGL